MILFALVSFILHPIQFVKDWVVSHREFDRHGNRRDGGL